MGLRRCDIAGLKLAAVDFDDDLLYIHQQKTSVPFTLPLTAIVGNAIYDYIEAERPETTCEYLFIAQKRPFGRISSSVINRVIGKIMNAADIRQNDGDRKGAHIFRHRFATKLLANGVPRVVISGLAGHLSPNTLDDYLSADFPKLKQCALSIECFPIRQEVFAI
jgi:integrase